MPPHFIYFLIFSLIPVIFTQNEVPVDSSVLKLVQDEIDLPEEHAQLYLNAFPDVIASTESEDGQEVDNSTNVVDVRKFLRWGYELDSTASPLVKRYSQPKCPGNHIGFVKNKDSQLSAFYSQADFGFVRQQIFELRLLCEATYIHDSSLECSKNLRYCNGRNLYLDLRDVAKREEPIRYHMDVLKEGQIGGFCRLNEAQLKEELGHLSALQSWAPEMRFFRPLEERPFVDGDLCDEYVDKPTVIMKIDASVNMYHHFCDFFNLYASLHVNATHKKFYDRDINILIWETHLYRSTFGDTFQAFTKNPLMDLTTFQGKRVCFRNVMFPLLPRMIFGLYYNTPIINGCHSSGLFRAFSEFILHRLRIPLHLPPPPEDEVPKVRITFLARKTKFRNVLNEEELVEAIKELSGVEVRLVVYSKGMQFKQQLEITRNTDVFMGMHGAGLTHLLFLPDWATIFELYNCEDAGCYRDLARLRGVRYMTWENSTKVFPEDEGEHTDGGAHAKFTNYKFDKDEFVRLVKKAVQNVKEDVRYRKFIGVKLVDEEEEEVCAKKGL